MAHERAAISITSYRVEGDVHRIKVVGEKIARRMGIGQTIKGGRCGNAAVLLRRAGAADGKQMAGVSISAIDFAAWSSG